MPLVVQVSTPEPTDRTGVYRINAAVRDDDYEQISATFGYMIGRVSKLTLRLGMDNARTATKTVDLRVALVSVHIDPDPAEAATAVLTISDIRDLPLSRWEAAARAHVVDPAVMEALPIREWKGYVGGGVVTTDPPQSGRKARSLAHLSEIAEQYQAELRLGTPDPAAAIANVRGVNRSTVRSWIHRARQAGLLLPAPERRLGAAEAE